MKSGFQGPTKQRLRMADEVRALREKGLTYRQIGERLGIRTSYANMLHHDPDGSKARARKDSYAGSCIDCGGKTSGSMGRGQAPLRCHRCAQGRLDSPSVRRPLPVRLCDLPLELRLAGAREANRLEQGDTERMEILLAALYPSETVYFVSERARPLLEAAA